ncbi:MAG TPA: SRPBCC domain-containing protein [Candidatus Acidoferrum sp.]|nr:SRPBCC domain-containing protein [Candidatus Acidoferrum sp.]
MTGAKVEPKVVHATCVVERSFSKPAGVVFAALSDPDKIRRWMGGSEHSELFEFGCEFREGGKQVVKYKMGPETPIPGAVITNEGRFQQIVPDERIVTASTMKMGDRIFSASQVTFELVPTDKGTDLILTHQGAFFQGSDGPKMREQGWNALMDKLVAVVNEP